jgi:hypothetical protein
MSERRQSDARGWAGFRKRNDKNLNYIRLIYTDLNNKHNYKYY